MQPKEPMPVTFYVNWVQGIELGICIAAGFLIFSLPFACLIFLFGGSLFR